MKNYLGLEQGADKAAFKKKAADLSSDELLKLAGELYEKAGRADNTSPGLQLTGAVGGFTVGELFNLVARYYIRHGLPGAGLLAGGYTAVRTVPHMLLSALALFLGRNAETKTQAALFMAGIGIGFPAASRIVDWIEHEGNASQTEIDQLRRENAELRAARGS